MTTALTTTVRHIQPGVTRVLHLPAIASPTLVPVRAELTSGTILDTELFDWSGWAATAAFAPSRQVGSAQVGGIPGVQTLQSSEFTFNASKTGVDVRTLFVEGLDGFVVIMDGGDVPGQMMDVFKTRVANTVPVRSADGSAVLMLKVAFGIQKWVQNVAIPTLT